MSNSVAEAYLTIVRESNVPIMGEAVPIPFTGQIELDSWSWNLKNDEAVKQREEAEKRFDDAEEKKAAKEKDAKAASAAKAKDNTPPFKADGLIRQVAEMQIKSGVPQKTRDLNVQQLIKKAVAGYAEAATADSDNDPNKENKGDNKMTLTFEKGVDLATTPLLFALARGDLMPRFEGRSRHLGDHAGQRADHEVLGHLRGRGRDVGRQGELGSNLRDRQLGLSEPPRRGRPGLSHSRHRARVRHEVEVFEVQPHLRPRLPSYLHHGAQQLP